MSQKKLWVILNPATTLFGLVAISPSVPVADRVADKEAHAPRLAAEVAVQVAVVAHRNMTVRA